MRYHFQIPLTFHHQVLFGHGMFQRENPTLSELFSEDRERGFRVVVFVEKDLLRFFPHLIESISEKLAQLDGASDCGIKIVQGGEESKVDLRIYHQVCDEIADAQIDRHSYVFAIGGGAFLDVVGFAAATVHRGVRLVRFPTTTLSQCDSGVGVKSGVNQYGKKNFMGAFAVPHAVVNDFEFLHTQPAATRLDGLVEAVKVALVKDAAFFSWIEKNLDALADLDEKTIQQAVERSAILHAKHIAEGGDPFESGSSRPLDFGHWSAHKLEQLSHFQLSHARAVSIGLAIDCLYSVEKGLLAEGECERVLQVLTGMGLPLWSELLESRDESNNLAVIAGLQEFREHLGGQLTILLLASAGEGVEVHEMDEEVLETVFAALKTRSLSPA